MHTYIIPNIYFKNIFLYKYKKYMYIYLYVYKYMYINIYHCETFNTIYCKKNTSQKKNER